MDYYWKDLTKPDILLPSLLDPRMKDLSLILSNEYNYLEERACRMEHLDFTTTQTRLDAVVHVYNEALLGRDGYWHLAAVTPILFHEYLVADHQNKINELINAQIRVRIFNINQDVNQDNDFNELTRENPIITSEDTLYIKLSGDGQNVGRKQNHVMVTFCLLNEGNEVLKLNHQFSICLYVGKEKYEILNKVGKIFALQLADLKENGIIDNDGIH
ncbi:hypothetical protein C1645_839650 [Glomus cerebriforme]|uniref:Uncharacterized protein n=1 Tax=Glomus cerebriforme TaxID=658196 RepID=A0A397S0G0_9GLOM|nr:hypothetical protein C1645_839650 [Glomus cerebriforme]